MATLHVRNVPDDLYELLRERAAVNDRSIGAETVQVLYERLVVGSGGPRPLSIPGFRRRTPRPVGAFTRFTAEARDAVVAAQNEARTLGHGRVGTEHLLLGVLAQDVPVTAALREIGVTLEGARSQIEPGTEAATGRLNFDPEAKRALEIALREATKLGHNVIAPMHVVLGVAAAEAGQGAALLRAAEPEGTKLRKCIVGAAGAPPLHAIGSPGAILETPFRVVALEGDAGEWESQLNELARLGYDLVEIIDQRAIFRR
jgi:ATP-dependent Clp protease ATP-binding subunit ClpC